MAKDLKLHTFEYHQKNSLDLMFLEWSLASKYLGKILLIIGPRSSGKSTLIPKVVDKFTNCFSINRKKIFFEVYEDIGQKYFTDILSEASSIMESNITLSNLMYPDTSKLSMVQQDKIKLLRQQVKDIMNDEDFKNLFLIEAFSACYQEVKKYIFNGYNVIIDEGLVDSEKSYKIFSYSFSYYPHIKTAMLFNSIENIFEYCKIRNKKSLLLLDKFENIQVFWQETIKLENKTGNSSGTFRYFDLIIEDYRKFFSLTSKESSRCIVLDKILKTRLEFLLEEMIMAQSYLSKMLIEKGGRELSFDSFIKIKQDLMYCNTDIFVLSKMHYDYIIDARKIQEIELLNDMDFLEEILSDILPWFIDGQYTHTHTTLSPFYNNNAISTISLFNEWHIWSKCFGKLIIVNGVSSSGKTTLVSRLSEFGWNIVSLDDILNKILFDDLNHFIPHLLLSAQKYLSSNDFLKLISGLKFNEEKYDNKSFIEYLKIEVAKTISKNHHTPLEIYSVMHHEAQKHLFCGKNVIIDTVMSDRSEVELFIYCFGNYPVLNTLLYSPLATNLENCFLRNKKALQSDSIDFRSPKQVVEQYCRFYSFKYSLADTSVVLEKINKENTLEILENVINELKFFLEAFDPCFVSEKEKIACLKKAYNSVSKVKSSIMIAGDYDIAITPIIKTDMIIKPSIDGYDFYSIKENDQLQDLTTEISMLLGGFKDIFVEY